MPLVYDVLAKLDERSMHEASNELEEHFKSSGHAAGEGFGENMFEGVLAGFHGGDFESLTGVLESAGLAAKATTSGEAIGAAFAAGIVTAAGAAMVSLGKEVGETFENINRQITVSTGATGQALEELKGQADSLVGSLDSSTAHLGSDFATLGGRLTMTSDQLREMTEHVTMLRDRMGDFNVGALAGAFRNMGVDGAHADDVLASLVQTTRNANMPLADMVTNLSANSQLFNDMHISVGQAANVIGEIERRGIPANVAIMGLQASMKGAQAVGEDYHTFVDRLARSLDYLKASGRDADAENLAFSVAGTRRWADLDVAAHAYLDTVRQGPQAFQAHGQSLTDLGNQTRTLSNYWDEVKNKIDTALAPGGETVVDVIGKKMEEFAGWITAHQDDLRRFFSGSIEVIEHVVEDIGQIASILGSHPALIQAAAAAFGTWEAIKGVDAVLTGLEAVGAWLVGAPAVAATAEVGVDAAMTGMAATTTAAGGEMALAFGPVMGELAAMPTEAEVAGTAITTSMTAADGAIIGLNASIDTAIASLGSLAAAAAPILAVAAGVAALYGIATATGSATGQEDTPDYTKGGATALGPDGKPLIGPDGKPITAGGPGSKPAPGAPAGTGRFAPGQSPTPDAGTRAAPTLPDTVTAATPGGDTGGPPSDLLTPDDLKPQKGAKKGLPQAPEVPYDSAYGAAPSPGETAEQYESQQRVLEQKHSVDMAQARLTQLEGDNNATAADVQKARNDVVKAQGDLNAAELRAYEEQNKQLTKHSDELGELGAKIDKDFGISKGLSGIADNLTKFVANLAAAPMLGAMQSQVEASGIKQLAPGAGGLIGMGAISGAFGPGFQPPAFGGTGGGFFANGYGPGRGSGSPLLSMLGLGGNGAGTYGGPGASYGPAGIQPGPFGGYPGVRGMAGVGLGLSGAGGPAVAVPAGGAVTQDKWGVITDPTTQLTSAGLPGGAQLAAGAPAALLGDFGRWFNSNVEPVTATAGYRSGSAFDHQIGSNHMSGTALDLNPDDFPGYSGGRQSGAPASSHFSPEQIAAIRAKLATYGGAIKWGEDFGPGDADPMHFEMGVGPTDPRMAALYQAAQGPIQGPGAVPGPDMTTDASGAVIGAPSAYQGADAPSTPAQQAAYTAMIQAGYAPSEWPALRNILGKESSGGDPTARNPSGAFGMYQFLGHENDKYGQLGAYSTDPAQQSVAGMAYIRDRYGSPSAAWAHWQQAGSYSGGGSVEHAWGNVTHALGNVGHAGSNVGHAITNISHALGGPQNLHELTHPWDRHFISPPSRDQTDNQIEHAPEGSVFRSLLGNLIRGGAAEGFAEGGGPRGTDTVPAWLTPREFVQPVDSVDFYGRDVMEGLRNRRIDPTSIRYLAGGGDDQTPPGQGEATSIGGASANKGYGAGVPGGSGGSALIGAAPNAGFGSGAAAMGNPAAAAASFGISIGVQEAQRAIQYAGQLGGIGMEAFTETFLPTGASKLAQNSWLSKIAGGLMGAQPQLPNMAGKSENTTPKGVSGMPGYNDFSPASTLAPSMQRPGMAPTPASVVPPPMATPTPQSVTQGAVPPAGAPGAAPGGQPATNAAPASYTGVYIDHYHVEHTEDQAGRDLAFQSRAAIPGRR